MEKTEIQRILVVSDTHRYTALIDEVLKIEEPVDILVHCGDAEYNNLESRYQKTIPRVYAVNGNMDWGGAYEKEVVFKALWCNFFVTHGHEYGVKYTRDTLYEAGRERQADVVLFGHTHVPEQTEKNGILILNPGSLAEPRQSGRQKTYAVIEVSADGSPPKVSMKVLEREML